MKFVAILAAAASVAAAQPALAAEPGSVSVGITAGTLGIGPEVGYRINDNVGIRGNATFFSVSHGFDSDDVAYDGKVKLKSGGAFVDVFPFGGGFRLSAGARINGNNGRLDATPTGTTEIGDEEYTAAEIGTITGRAEVKDFAPQLTLGYGGSIGSGLSFGFEAGALFQGRVRIKNFTSTGTLSDNADFQDDLEEERLELQDDVDDYKVYPILQLGLKYRF